jgi:hypothetical protein
MEQDNAGLVVSPEWCTSYSSFTGNTLGRMTGGNRYHLMNYAMSTKALRTLIHGTGKIL